MKTILTIIALAFFLALYAQGQTRVDFNISIRDEGGTKYISVAKSAWTPRIQNDEAVPVFEIMPLHATGNFASSKSALTIFRCDRVICLLNIPPGFTDSGTFFLVVDVDGQRFWGEVAFKYGARLLPSKDADRKKSELLLKSNVPMSLRNGEKVELTQDRMIINQENTAIINDPNPPTQQATVVSYEDGDSNLTEVNLKLEKKINDGLSKSFKTTSQFNSTGGVPLTAAGKIDIPGQQDPPAEPKSNITLFSEAAESKTHNLLVKGVAGFRRPKFATLLGRYTPCADPSDDAQQGRVAVDRISEECRKGRDSFSQLLFGELGTSESKIFFAGIEPKITFDFGSKSSSTKNFITFEAPFITYFNFSERSTIDVGDVPRGAIPLNLYGGWKKTPLLRLASIKFFVGPKLVLHKDPLDKEAKWYDFHPKNLLIETKAEFEFHKLLGTISDQRGLIKADFDTAQRGGEYYKFRGADFGWKFVPYVGFEGGGSFYTPTIEKTLGGVFQSVEVPSFGVASFRVGAEGRVEWLIYNRIFGINTNYSLIYMASSEKDVIVRDNLLFIRSIRGLHPYLKTSFEVSLDPAKRLYFTTSWENGMALPSLDYLNRLTTGFTVKY